MSTLFAVDPGPSESAFALIDIDSRKPITFGKVTNEEARILLGVGFTFDQAAIEMIASYGMAVGAEVFDTCVHIGRFVECLNARGMQPELVKRKTIALHHCNSPRAGDSNVRQALVDRFAPGQPNHGKGTKAEPGWFYGFAADVWAAYALAVYAADQAVAP